MEGGPDYRSQLDTRCDSGRAQSCQSRDSLREPMKRVLQIKFPHPLPELHALPLSAASTPKKVHKGQMHGVDSLVSSPSLSVTPTTSPQGPTSPLAVIRDGRISQSTSKTGWRRIRHWCVTSSRISKREEILCARSHSQHPDEPTKSRFILTVVVWTFWLFSSSSQLASTTKRALTFGGWPISCPSLTITSTISCECKTFHCTSSGQNKFHVSKRLQG